MFVYHFVDPDLKVKIFFENKGTAENGGVDFEISTSACLEVEAFLTCTFISLLLISFDLPSYSSESRKRYMLRLLLMCLEALGKKFSSFRRRDWEGVSRKLLSLVKMYQRIWINLSQNLIMVLLIMAVWTVLS